MAHRSCQALVNAQVAINRLVFVANKAKADPAYMIRRIIEAQSDLAEAAKLILGREPREGRKKA